MILERKSAQPNKHTFIIPPITEFVMKYFDSKTLWIDPFCGYHSPVDYNYRNDLDSDVIAFHHLEAKDFLKLFVDESVDGIIFDPPYSLRQLKEVYNSIGIEKISFDQSKTFTNSFYTRDIWRVLKPGGIVLKFGWNSNRFNSHFKILHVLLVNHGGGHHDTLCTAQMKIQSTLSPYVN